MYIPPLRPELGVLAQESGLDLGGGGLGLNIALLIASFLLFTFFTSMEAAVLTVSRVRVKHLASQGNRAARAIERIWEREDRFFAFVILGQNLFLILATALATAVAIDVAGEAGWGAAAAIILLTVAAVIFGEMTPKIFAVRAAERYALVVGSLIHFLMLALMPLLAVIAFVPDLLSRLLLGKRLGKGPTVTEGELRMLIDIGAAEGVVEKGEAELLEGVFHFGDRRVNEVMIPRTEVVWLEKGMTIADLYAIFSQHSHSRFPVFEDSPDNVIGIVGIKDVLRGLAEKQMDEGSQIDLAMRPALFVPETKFVGALFFEMQHSGHQMAIVVDEYGGTEGLVTLETLLEELVGYVGDELHRHDEEVISLDERTVEIDGGMSISDANEDLELGLPEGKYETVAGFVLSHLGRIPEQGEQFIYNGLHVTVTEVRAHKVERLTVTRLQQ
ncbi:MAG: HlyC/CorC family transporter [Chloroflexi bacterium]|nr:HlyC/CorC family transporter [Chloroflexota bacterium]